MTLHNLWAVSKENAGQMAAALSADDIKELITLLNEKDDKTRYAALLLLQGRSQSARDVYPYFDVFVDKIGSDNSYQRSIGLMLAAENARWDTLCRLDGAIGRYLNCVRDEKPITARQCIQALPLILAHKPQLSEPIARALMDADIGAQRPTMKKLILMDILSVLLLIRQCGGGGEAIDAYIAEALTGGILDDKSKKQIAKAFAQQKTAQA